MWLVLVWSVPLYAATPAPWVLVDTRSDKLIVMGGDGPLEEFLNVALGVRGAGLKRQLGDGITPLGSFRVAWINQQSKFDIFMGLNYPNKEYAALGRYEGRIDSATYEAIRGALDHGRRPPQRTLLGGHIGIHGIGPNDPFIHANTNWTDGCVALTNEQIRRLQRWVTVGTRVEIR